jgi:co-chaperonin GroES (HSP10)
MTLTESEPAGWRTQGDVKPLRNRVLVHLMEHGDQKLASGLIIPDDNGTARGIKPRWCVVYAVGSEIDYLTPGDHVLVAHGRWTRGVHVIRPDGVSCVVRMVEPEAIMGVQNPS